MKKLTAKESITKFIVDEQEYIERYFNEFRRLANEEAEEVGYNEYGYISDNYQTLNNVADMLEMHLMKMKELKERKYCHFFDTSLRMKLEKWIRSKLYEIDWAITRLKWKWENIRWKQ